MKQTAMANLVDRCSATTISTEPDILQSHGRDWTRLWSPAPGAVAFPRSLDEVRQLVTVAREEKVALVPSGGRTGLSGGAVAARGELVVSFDKMNRIGPLNPEERTVDVEAGVVTARLQEFARGHQLFYPVDFASTGSSQIGGNIATNAGGVKVLRYGLTRDWINGLVVVDGRGEVLRLNQGLIKNASGYDLRHLMIGSEGTLGFIVEATIQLTELPPPQSVMVLGCESMGMVMQVFAAAQRTLNLSAYEFFSDKALGHVLAHSDLSPPFDESAPYYVLLEFDDVEGAGEVAAAGLFETVFEEGWIVDGVISQSGAQAESLWALRERISESIASAPPYKNDLSVRISRVEKFLTTLDALVAERYPDFEVVWFGHIGDGNLHLNILKPPTMELDAFRRACEQVNSAVFGLVRELGGSISAEHGVGLLKADYLEYTRDPAEIAAMRGIKQVFDPDGILNPGKLFAE